MRKTVIILFFLTVSCNLLYSQNVGIGTTNPTQKLDVVGNLRVSGAIMPGGTAGSAGQVLTSNGAGQAPTWETLVAPGGGKFWLTIANNARSTGTVSGRGDIWNLSSGTSQDDSLDIAISVETGTDFTISNPGLVNNYITVNRTGLYHFEGVIRYFATSDLSISMFCRATLNLFANRPSGTDPNLHLIEDRMELTGSASVGASVNNYNYTAKFSINIHLEANTTIAFMTGFNLLRLSGADPLIAMGVSSGGYISGHFISE
jgi:hypothetical protein